jgi:hypothetical protein
VSTKSTIRYDSDESDRTGFHLYSEAFDEEHVYLELDGFHFDASSMPDLTFEEPRPRITLKLPNDWAKRLKLIE